MLQQRTTRTVRSRFNDVMSGEIIHEEGMALVYVKEDGSTKVKLSSGAAGEIFAGVSQSRNSPPAFLPFVQEQAVPTSKSMQLVRVPVAGQLFVSLNGTQAPIVAGAPAAGEAGLSGTTLTFNTADVGANVFAQFLYTPTVLEARQVIGDPPIGGLSSTPQQRIGTLHDAELGTNMFDASIDWSDVFYAKTGPGGTFTAGTEADHTPGVIVKVAPSAANPFLVLAVQVAG